MRGLYDVFMVMRIGQMLGIGRNRGYARQAPGKKGGGCGCLLTGMVLLFLLGFTLNYPFIGVPIIVIAVAMGIAMAVAKQKNIRRVNARGVKP